MCVCSRECSREDLWYIIYLSRHHRPRMKGILNKASLMWVGNSNRFSRYCQLGILTVLWVWVCRVTVINYFRINYYSFWILLSPGEQHWCQMLKRQFSPTLEASISSVSSLPFTNSIRPSHWVLRLGSEMTLVTGVIDRRCEGYRTGYLHRSCRN